MRQTHLILASLVAGTIGFTALAQPAGTKEEHKGEPAKAPAARPNRGGPGGAGPMTLEPEKAKAAWEAEATAVAKRLKMNDDQTKAVVKAYNEARESYAAAMQKANEDFRSKGGGGGGGREDLRSMIENVNKAEKEKFEKALGAAKFSAEDTTKLSASLGTFNRSWDRLADAILGMKLDSDKQQQSLEAIETFVVEQTKITSKAGAADVDREAIRTATTANSKKLSDTLGKILTAEQAKSIDELIARGMGNIRGGGAGGNRGGTPDGEKKPEGEKKKDDKGGK